MGFLDFLCDITDVVAGGVQDFVEVCNAADGQASRPARNPQQQIQIPVVPPPPPTPQRTQTQLFHGGRLEAVMDIFRYNRVKIGQSMPRGFYVMTEIDEAMAYAAPSGGIVEVYIPLSVTFISSDNKCAFYKPMPKSVVGKYYHIPGMRPVRVFNINKRQVA